MKNWLKNNWLNVAAMAILFGSGDQHPYSYYQALRWIVCVAALYVVYMAKKVKRFVWMWIFIAVAVLFNPIAPFYFSRSTWQEFDFWTLAIFFVVLFANFSEPPEANVKQGKPTS